jgi:hypothetical protein
MPIIVDSGVVVTWGAIVGGIIWLINEIRKEWKALKKKVEECRKIIDCEKLHLSEQEQEKETRIRISEAVKAEREAHYGGN